MLRLIVARIILIIIHHGILAAGPRDVIRDNWLLWTRALQLILVERIKLQQLLRRAPALRIHGQTPTEYVL